VQASTTDGFDGQTATSIGRHIDIGFDLASEMLVAYVAQIVGGWQMLKWAFC